MENTITIDSINNSIFVHKINGQGKISYLTIKFDDLSNDEKSKYTELINMVETHIQNL
jgi:hypothetical protein